MAGLPKVMLKKKEELKAEYPDLQVAEQPQKIMIPIDPPNGEFKSVESEPAKVEETQTPSLEEQWRIEKEKWEQKYRSLQGQISNLEPELRSERELRAKLEQELVKLREFVPPPTLTVDPDEELTKEEAEVYGASAPVIQKIAKKIARGELSNALKDLRKEIEELRTANTRVQTDLTQTGEQQFLAHVKSAIPKFDTIVASEEWKDYISARLPRSKRTIYDSLVEAHEARDLDIIKEIFNEFKPKKSPIESMRTPSLESGAAPISTNGQQKPILKWSDRKRISDDFRMGRINKAKKDEWDKIFKEAESENRIDFSK